MKWLFSFALALAVTDLAEAQTCTYDFCGGSLSNIPDPTLIVNPDEDPGEQIDCETVLATSSFFPADECESALMMVEVLCCPDNAVQTCFLCGSDVTYNKAKELPGADGMTCEDINNQLAFLPTDELCTGAKAEFGSMIDIPAFCECAGASAPNVCEVCGTGFKLNSTKLVPDGPEEGFTCGDGATFMSYVANETLCDELLDAEAKSECCYPDSAGTRLYYSVSAFVIGWLAFAF